MMQNISSPRTPLHPTFFILIALLALAPSCSSFSIQQGKPRPSKHIVHRIFTGNDGQSHMEQLPMEMNPFSDTEGSYGHATASLFQSDGVSFRTWPAGFEMDWHTAPRRQLVIVLRGEIELEVDSGAKRRVSLGDVLLAEDVTGQGHQTRVVGEEDFFYAIVPLEEEEMIVKRPKTKKKGTASLSMAATRMMAKLAA